MKVKFVTEEQTLRSLSRGKFPADLCMGWCGGAACRGVGVGAPGFSNSDKIAVSIGAGATPCVSKDEVLHLAVRVGAVL